MYKLILVSHILIIAYIIYLVSCGPPTNYGEFKLKIGKFDICKGPKRMECTEINSTVENETILKLDMLIKKDTIPKQGKILAIVNGKPLVRLQMKKPCDHLFMKPLFQKIYNASQNCEFKKGRYAISVDIQDTAQSYYGGMFFYGNVTFKSVFYNEQCNFSCAIVEVMFVPKK